MSELLAIWQAMRAFTERIAAEATLVEIISLMFLCYMGFLYNDLKKECKAAYKMAFDAQKESITIALKSIETTSKISEVVHILKEERPA